MYQDPPETPVCVTRRLICPQVRHDSRVRREDREGRAGIGGLARCQDLPGRHYLPPVRQVHRLQRGTEAAQTG